MISSSINELTVFADKLEDEGMNVSLLRLSCQYNYLIPLLCQSYSMIASFEYGYGGLHYASGCSDGYNSLTDYEAGGNQFYYENKIYDGYGDSNGY